MKLRIIAGWLVAGLFAVSIALVGPGSVATASPAGVQQAASESGVLSHCRELNNHPQIARGNYSLYVAHAQCLLKYHYGQDIDVDWDFGPLTEKAVMNVQRVCGLDVDGIVGAKTWPVLHKHGTC